MNASLPTIQFETPEHVHVAYRLAGPGTRFLAFFLDAVILLLAQLFMTIIFVIASIGVQAAGEAGNPVLDAGAAVMVSIYIILSGFMLLLYFILFEMFMNGQTPGKHAVRCRVVMEHGFSLSAGAILIRGIFRMIDVIPILWVVPLANAKFQRFGDMVAGTVVVSEDPPRISPVRAALADRAPDAYTFSFSAAQTRALRPVDVRAAETYLERREVLHPDHRRSVLQKLLRGISHRIQYPYPVPEDQGDAFLEDLLTAHYRQEARGIA